MANLEQLEAADTPNLREMQKKLEAVRKGIAAMKELCGDDAELLGDMIEGETGLYEFANIMVANIQNDDTLITAIKLQEDALRQRRSRIEKRLHNFRNILALAIDEAEAKTLELPAATVTISANKPNLMINEEADIPAKYWKEQDPKLDRAALRKDALDGQSIPGVGLDNGSIKVTIRTT